ncbi:hypothetical protein GCM10022384_07610 [Streptomyces marokkonensis]|uniref:Uncharacterized protein n=1 Tax=Streptomyces marokkonensis TaxID=324855 RepID=A0ABP7P0D6_9ACTN
MIARLLGAAIVALPLISLALLGLGRAGQALAHHARNTMSHAQRTITACHTGAFLASASAGYSALHHPLLIVPGLAGAVFLLWGASSIRDTAGRWDVRDAALDAAAAADEQMLPTNTDHRSAA